ncbi:hypothetical protein BZB76_4193 [Actinomadura pelletieri DSM 43383]|uniref:Uncharacterized protein n=1 Tax=Actinomadura pelletieri DSM 43383 TaxID=1120940 RepID=A0A495QLP6_9ACTN|nr:hypothetical protein [Actinomadura pelletieri]RKS73500.1 hypothetical protein BZB76_4193 [Actinomadura pelletieri DSM 43383]
MTGGISLSGGPAGRWTLVHDGRRLQVETGRVGWNRVVRLFVDGDLAGETTTDWLTATLPYGEPSGGSSVVVGFDALGFVDGQAARCDLVPSTPGEDEAGPDTATIPDSAPTVNLNKDRDEARNEGEEVGAERVAFEPAEGTRAARREALARAHPTLYASRHVVVAVGRVLFPLLGLGLLVRALLRALPSPDVRLPGVDLPSIPRPDIPWPDVPWPDPPDVSVPPWVTVILATAKFWGPILVAVGVTVREARRRRRQAARPARSSAESPSESPSESSASEPIAPPARRDRRS